MANLTGQRLGQYEITQELGRGGMAVVYRARQLNIERDVAIKVIKPDLAAIGDLAERFQREAKTIASLQNPHILKLFDYGQHEDILYFVMELISGGSLADLLRGGALPPERIATLLDQITDALDYAHSRGVIHRDLKPQNILLDERGNAHLTDFGIAKLLGQAAPITQTGLAVGTPAYMSPEQWQGKALDVRADIYALGIMLFEMLTGKLPFNGDTPYSMMHYHIYEAPPSVQQIRPDLPPPVEQVVSKALAKNSDERFASAGQMATAFRNALHSTAGKQPETIRLHGKQSTGETLLETAIPGTTGAAIVSKKSSHRMILPIVAALAVIVVVAFVLLGSVLSPASVANNPTITLIVPTNTPTFDPFAAAQATTVIESTINAARTQLFNKDQTATAKNVTVTSTLSSLDMMATKLISSVTPTPTITKPTRTPIPSATPILPGMVLFENNFEDSDALATLNPTSEFDWWSIVSDGTNKVLDAKCAVADGCRGSGLAFGSGEWTNYAVDFRTKMINQNADIDVSFRTNAPEGYVYRMSLRSQTTSLVVNSDSGWKVIKERTYSFQTGVWYHIRLEAQGQTIRAFINDKLQAEITDTSFKAGNIVFNLFSDSHVQFDDIRVTALAPEPTATPTPTIQPAFDLPTGVSAPTIPLYDDFKTKDKSKWITRDPSPDIADGKLRLDMSRGYDWLTKTSKKIREISALETLETSVGSFGLNVLAPTNYAFFMQQCNTVNVYSVGATLEAQEKLTEHSCPTTHLIGMQFDGKEIHFMLDGKIFASQPFVGYPTNVSFGGWPNGIGSIDAVWIDYVGASVTATKPIVERN